MLALMRSTSLTSSVRSSTHVRLIEQHIVGAISVLWKPNIPTRPLSVIQASTMDYITQLLLAYTLHSLSTISKATHTLIRIAFQPCLKEDSRNKNGKLLIELQLN